MSFTRANIQKIPARLVYNSSPAVSLYAKEDSAIAKQLVTKYNEVGAAGVGLIDKRDEELYFRVTITPDGRVTSANANDVTALLFPYGNPTIGAGIFTDTDVTLSVHGNDSSLDTFSSCALEKMPEMYFHPTKTLFGPAGFLCLRTSATDWSAANSLITEAGSGGTFVDANFTTAGIIKQNYTAIWTGMTGFSSATDFYDGLTFQPMVQFEDDTVARYGLYNRRIKAVGGIVRGIPLGQTRQNLTTAARYQYTGAARGGSRAAGGAQLQIKGADGNVYLTLYGAALTDLKGAWGVQPLRQGEVAWAAFPVLTAGVRGPYFTVMS